MKLGSSVGINFDDAGLWQVVEMRIDTQAFPTTAFILPPIVQYVTENYTSVSINGIDKELNGFDVELTNDIDLVFDKDG